MTPHGTDLYFRPKHEVYRQWVALSPPPGGSGGSSGEKVGVCGYLKFSACVLAPGEKPPVHDEDADAALEESGPMRLLMPANVEVSTVWLEVTVFRLEDLPVLDDSLLMVRWSGSSSRSRSRSRRVRHTHTHTNTHTNAHNTQYTATWEC